jgi:hypothetical protein
MTIPFEDYHCQQAENEDVADIVGQLRPRERVQYSPDLDRNVHQPLYILVLFDPGMKSSSRQRRSTTS